MSKVNEKRKAKSMIHEYKGIVSLIINGNYKLAKISLEGYLKSYVKHND